MVFMLEKGVNDLAIGNLCKFYKNTFFFLENQIEWIFLEDFRSYDYIF